MTEDQIKEVADYLDGNLVCYYNVETGTVEYHPDPDGLYFDPEPWQELLDQIEANWEKYIHFRRMNSSQAFHVMEDFVLSLEGGESKDRLIYALSRPKPFHNFRYEINQTEFLEKWYEYKLQALIDWVRDQFVDWNGSR